MREAENLGGLSCGTVGHARTRFRLDYNFLSKEYQKPTKTISINLLGLGIQFDQVCRACQMENEEYGFFMRLKQFKIGACHALDFVGG